MKTFTIGNAGWALAALLGVAMLFTTQCNKKEKPGGKIYKLDCPDQEVIVRTDTVIVPMPKVIVEPREVVKEVVRYVSDSAELQAVVEAYESQIAELKTKIVTLEETGSYSINQYRDTVFAELYNFSYSITTDGWMEGFEYQITPKWKDNTRVVNVVDRARKSILIKGGMVYNDKVDPLASVQYIDKFWSVEAGYLFKSRSPMVQAGLRFVIDK